MIKNISRILLIGLFLFAVTGGLFAKVTQEENDAILAFANDPQNMEFADLNRLVQMTTDYELSRGIVNQNKINEFFRNVQQHGVPDAGKGTNQIRVAMVMQNHGNDVIGTLVLKGEFDQQNVIATIKKHYFEHSNEHAAETAQKQGNFAAVHGETANNPYQEVTGQICGYQAHIYPMPLQNRELIIVATKGGIVASSAPRGQRNLLNQTIAVVDGRVPMKGPASETKINLAFSPSQAEKDKIEKMALERYDQEKKDSLSKKKFLAKTGERIRQKVIRSKVQFVLDSIQDMDQTTVAIKRSNVSERSKKLIFQVKFQNQNLAADVKKKIVKHLVKEIQKTQNPKDKFALGNIGITQGGNYVFVKCELDDASEQLHAFNLISSYVSRGVQQRL
ncbi:MAG: hypothetical protein HQM10_22485 [Candidatus Riflebacteria bacterium]|nr:hypothetical protein [Candidatus Riflebacteria bacterium]